MLYESVLSHSKKESPTKGSSTSINDNDGYESNAVQSRPHNTNCKLSRRTRKIEIHNSTGKTFFLLQIFIFFNKFHSWLFRFVRVLMFNVVLLLEGTTQTHTHTQHEMPASNEYVCSMKRGKTVPALLLFSPKQNSIEIFRQKTYVFKKKNKKKRKINKKREKKKLRFSVLARDSVAILLPLTETKRAVRLQKRTSQNHLLFKIGIVYRISDFIIIRKIQVALRCPLSSHICSTRLAQHKITHFTITYDFEILIIIMYCYHRGDALKYVRK